MAGSNSSSRATRTKWAVWFVHSSTIRDAYVRMAFLAAASGVGVGMAQAHQAGVVLDLISGEVELSGNFLAVDRRSCQRHEGCRDMLPFTSGSPLCRIPSDKAPLH